MAALMATLGASGVTSMTSQPPTLEELFLRHYQKDQR
jgi:ABC-2 type transport system ATP-binding protein